jgi:pimeloyl-ACP methyl ester carboxylesterase
LWFSALDADGWFRVTATDPRGASWSTYCRAPTRNVWPPLERALAESLRQSLDLVGDVDLESMARPKAT